MAASTTVTTMAELRSAIGDAGIDVINIDPGSYVLTSSGSGELAIDRDLTIQNTGGGRVVIDGDSASRVFNITGGAVTFTGLTITGGSVTGTEEGGGILIGSGATSLTMTKCTVSGNSTEDDGGAFKAYSTATMTNCTISGNTSGDGGSGWEQEGVDVTCTNSTIASNSATGTGGGAKVKTGATLTIKNTIFADNTASSNDQIHIDGGSLSSNGYNVVEGGGVAGLEGSDITSDPGLASLADNGGDSYTHAISAGSAAHDAGNDADAPSTDQRGISRPQESASDIGAFEYQPPYRVDNQIRNQGEGSYTGDGTYNTDGTSQAKSQSVNNEATATYDIKIENDGNTSDTFTVTGTASGSGWTVTYYDALTGGSDITASVTGSGWSTGSLASGASTEIRVEVTPDDTVAGGASKEVLVTSTSAGDSSQDAVKATTTVVQWYNTSWQYRKPITIDNTKVDANLTNFPVLISMTDTDLRDDAQNDGDDILFTSSDGSTKLSHEIESFDGSSGELAAWVKIPSLSASADTVIYMYYGNAGASSQQDAANVWDSNFLAVYHLHEDPSGTLYDSTSNNIDLTPYNTPTHNASSIIGGGIDLNDASNEYLASSSSITAESFTIEAWTSADEYNNYPTIVEWANAERCVYFDDDFSGALTFWVATGGLYYRLSGGLSGNAWRHLVVTYDDGLETNRLKGYINGSSTGYTENPSFSSRTGNVEIGRESDARNYYFDGRIDEVRISNIARNADWSTTCYNNQNSPSTFYSAGAEDYAYQPDNQIRNQGEGSYTGDDTYNADGASQAKSQSVDNDNTATYDIKMENDGNNSDTFTVTGTAGGSGWGITYYDALTGGSDITASVTGGGWSTGSLASGASTEIRVEVTPDDTVAGGSSKEVLVTSTSAGDSSQDAVKATTTVNTSYQPDNQIRNQGEGSYTGDGTYNTDGTSQAKSQSVDSDNTATYDIKIENDGNNSDTFTVTGTAGGSGWTVTYYDALTGGSDITASVTGGGWSTGSLAYGASTEIRAEVTPDDTVASGASKEVLVTSTSAGDSSQDAVKATTTRIGGGSGVGHGAFGGVPSAPSEAPVAEPTGPTAIDFFQISMKVGVEVGEEGAVGALADTATVDPATGELQEPVSVAVQDAETPDFLTTFEFDKGTKVASKEGDLPAKIVLETYTDTEGLGLPPSPPSTDIVLVRNIEAYPAEDSEAPVSVDISPPARLTFTYNPAKLPENTSSVSIAYHDADQGWTTLSTVYGGDVGVGEVTVELSHFSFFALIAHVEAPPEPAYFEVQNLNISPKQIEVGESVTIITQLINTGGLKGEHTLTLNVGDLVETSPAMELAPGESREISFTVSPDSPGTYPVEIAGLQDNLVVEAVPPPPSTFRSDIYYQYAWLGGAIFIFVAVIAIASAKPRKRLRPAAVVEEPWESGGAAAKKPEEPGGAIVEEPEEPGGAAAEEPKGMVAGAFYVSNLNIRPDMVKPGGSICIVSAEAANTSSTEGSYSLVLRVNGQVEAVKEITLEPGQSQKVGFTIMKAKPGVYDIDLEGLKGSLTVQESNGSPGNHNRW